MNLDQLLSYFFNYFTNLEKLLQNFKSQALTMEKALDSIQFEESEISKKILLTKKKVKQSELVVLDLALKYLSMEKLLIKIFNFFGKVAC